MILARNILTSGSGEAKEIPRGSYVLSASGTFDGAHIQLQLNVSDIGWVNDTGVKLDSPGTLKIVLPACLVRATVLNAGASTDVSVSLDMIGD